MHAGWNPRRCAIMKILKYLLAGFVALLMLLLLAVWIYDYSRLPDLEGEYVVKGLKGEARIVRDQWGVPHVSAGHGEDAYFAYGYAIAQDRLFQMEMQRRLAKGELAEVLGPKLVKVDRMFRTLMIRKRAVEYLSRPAKIDRDALKLTDAFMAGINHFIKTGPLPVEFAILGFEPGEFTRLDAAVTLGYMAYNFVWGLEADAVYGMVKEALPEGDVSLLFPGYSREKEPVSIMETPVGYLEKNAALTPFLPEAAVKTAALLNYEKTGTCNELGRLLAVLRAGSMYAPIPDGSNSWVMGPSRSVTGGAILANDPHVSLSNPGIWYEAHVKYGDVENYGYFIGAIPFPMLAHNSRRGWTVTMFENDDCDLYYETFHPEKKNLVKYRGRWVKVERFTETIRVKGEADQEVTVTVTPHGPVMTDFIDGYEGKPVSMQWVHLKVDNPMLDAAYKMSVADTIDDFQKAAGLIADPGFNISYADARGNIAWWAVGRLPVYPAHVNTMTILDGASGRDEVLRYLPFSSNPRLKNPPGGIIVTSNNLTTKKPVGPIRQLSGYWCPVDRAARIIELLRTKKKWSIEELKKVQTDVKSWSAPMVIGQLTAVVKKDDLEGALEKQAYDILAGWDSMNTINSTGATVFHYFTYHLTVKALQDELGEKLCNLYMGLHDHWNFFRFFIGDEKSPFWDDVTTDKAESRKDVMIAAFKGAVLELQDKLGSDPRDWEWGRVHTIEYAHPLGSVKPLNLVFNIGPFPAPGAFRTVSRFKPKFEKHDYLVKSIPSNRRLVDFSNVEGGQLIQPSGNSGNHRSPNYDDQVDMYLAGEYRTINFTPKQVQQNAKKVIVFRPWR